MSHFQRDVLKKQFKLLSGKYSELNGFKDEAEFVETWKRQKNPDKTIQLEGKNVAYRPDEDAPFGPENIKWLSVLSENDWSDPTDPVLKGYDEW